MLFTRYGRGKALLSLIVFCAGLVPSLGSGQAYPNRPITLVTPYAAGSGIDAMARALASQLSQRLGQSVIVDNKPGTSGLIGSDFVIKAAPNGYTLMATVGPAFVITPLLFKRASNPVADFTHIARIGTGSMALVVNPVVFPVKTLQELVAAVRAQPGKFNYASSGSGTSHHLGMEVLKQQLGLDVVHVPYKSAPAAMTDLLGGQTQMGFFPVNSVLSHVKAGKLAVIAVSGKGRSALAPDSPSFDEVGLSSIDLDLYYFISGPAHMPRDLVTRLNDEITTIMQSAEVREQFLKLGNEAATSTPGALTALITTDAERWKKFISHLKITAD